MDRSLSGALIKLHTSMLGTFFVYTLAQSMPIFKKKFSQIHIRVSRHKYNAKVAIALVLPFTANSANSRTVLAGIGFYVIKLYKNN